MKPAPTGFEQLKAAVIAVLIGAAITIIGDVAQYAIHWLQHYPITAAGPLGGMIKYIAWRASHPNV